MTAMTTVEKDIVAQATAKVMASLPDDATNDFRWILDCAREFAETCFMAIGDNAFRFSCGEMDTIAALFHSVGVDPTELVSMHIAGDEHYDSHLHEFYPEEVDE